MQHGHAFAPISDNLSFGLLYIFELFFTLGGASTPQTPTLPAPRFCFWRLLGLNQDVRGRKSMYSVQEVLPRKFIFMRDNLGKSRQL